MALRLLKGTLIRLFTTPSIVQLVEVSSTTQCRIDFSVAATDVSQGFGWCRTSTQTAFRVLCKVLTCTTIDPAFTNTIRLLPAKKERNIILSRKYSQRPPADPARMRLESWVHKLREYTKCKSDLSLRNIMNFFCSVCLPAFGLDLSISHDVTKGMVDTSIHFKFLKCVT